MSAIIFQLFIVIVKIKIRALRFQWPYAIITTYSYFLVPGWNYYFMTFFSGTLIFFQSSTFIVFSIRTLHMRMASSRLFDYYRKSLASTQTERRLRRSSGCKALRAGVCNFPGNVWPREEVECCTPTLRFVSGCPKLFPSVPPLPSATNKGLSMIYPSAKCRQCLSMDGGLPVPK